MYFDPDYGFIGYLLDTQNKPFKDTIFHRHSTRPGIFLAKDKEIGSILKKLYELFGRYEKQRDDFEASMQVAYGSLININSKRNLHCRR